MNDSRNYYQMQLEGHPLAPPAVVVGEEELARFRELVRRGQGKRDFGDGCKYVGEFRGGDLHGKGTYVFDDGSKYEGEWEHGWMHGKGRYTVKEQHFFEGEYREGQREGQGCSPSPWPPAARARVPARDSARQRAEFRGAPRRTVQYENGIKYEGEFKDSQMSGTGPRPAPLPVRRAPPRQPRCTLRHLRCAPAGRRLGGG
jgi:hypothetical protein